ncbi:MAG: hypothetical protein B6D55_04785 [Candidatus Omnitrophica bacterium 4484_70.2]|nr:MAG: hypothetical protein B6D55_04785 [Candidatus Omnitrophica bacterium 4484_70.2]
MKVLKGILKESKEYYIEIKRKIEKKIGKLPKGSVKERKIRGRRYYYLQYREGKRVIHKYLGKNKPEELVEQIEERKALLEELKKVNEALVLINRTERKR